MRITLIEIKRARLIPLYVRMYRYMSKCFPLLVKLCCCRDRFLSVADFRSKLELNRHDLTGRSGTPMVDGFIALCTVCLFDRTNNQRETFFI